MLIIVQLLFACKADRAATQMEGGDPAVMPSPSPTASATDLASFLAEYLIDYATLEDPHTSRPSTKTTDDPVAGNPKAFHFLCRQVFGVFNKSRPSTNSPVNLEIETVSNFCSQLFNKQWLGNADNEVSGYEMESNWIVPLMPQLNISVTAPIGDNFVPYLKKIKYRSVPTANGLCELEMRVYKKEVSQTNLNPLLAFHGGAWRLRRAGFYGFENLISHFTEREFVVFAPFYRLTGKSDGPDSCNSANGKEILDDVLAAKQWVLENGPIFGADAEEKLRLYGQSAGGHLAARVLVENPEHIEKALLMYAPLDFSQLVAEFKKFESGLEYSSDYEGKFKSAPSLAAFLQDPLDDDPVTLEHVNIQSDLVVENSFPNIVVARPQNFPPLFLLHGNADTLVPSVQSKRMCRAYNGSLEKDEVLQTVAGRSIYKCGTGVYHELDEAEHIAEMCLPGLFCKSGKSPQSIALLKSSLQTAYSWLSE